MKTLLAALAALAITTGAANATGKPADCPSPWCACWLWHHLDIPKEIAKKLGLNLASNWRHNPTQVQVGAIGFRWRRGGGHVGVVTEVREDGVMLLSGNHNGTVATAFYPMRGMSFFTNPAYSRTGYYADHQTFGGGGG